MAGLEQGSGSMRAQQVEFITYRNHFGENGVAKTREEAMRIVPTSEMLQQHYTNATTIFSELVTPEGNYASSPDGDYNGLFGRDSAFMKGFALENVMQMKKHENTLSRTDGVVYIHQDKEKKQLTKSIQPWEKLFETSVLGFLVMDNHQSTRDNPKTGEEKGRAAHEVRTDPKTIYRLTEEKERKGEKKFHVDENGILKNWDTVDAGYLRVIMIGRTLEFLQGLKESNTPLSESLKNVQRLLREKVQTNTFKDLVQWCINNTDKYGFPGFSCNTEIRDCTNFPNKHWADSTYPLQHEDQDTPYPKKPVEVAAYGWAAFKYAADIYKETDPGFSDILQVKAAALKDKFNKFEEEGGFLMKDEKTSLVYPAEGIDGEGRQIKVIMCNPALSLFAYYKNDHILEKQYRADLIKRVMQPDMFNAFYGLRTYSTDIKKIDPVRYHKGVDTYWSYVSIASAIGMDALDVDESANDLKNEAVIKLMNAGIMGNDQFATLPEDDPDFAPEAELFLADGNGIAGQRGILGSRLFTTPEGQVSCRRQGWAAGADAVASTHLLLKRGEIPQMQNTSSANEEVLWASGK